jgi:hypothetical protein
MVDRLDAETEKSQCKPARKVLLAEQYHVARFHENSLKYGQIADAMYSSGKKA